MRFGQEKDILQIHGGVPPTGAGPCTHLKCPNCHRNNLERKRTLKASERNPPRTAVGSQYRNEITELATSRRIVTCRDYAAADFRHLNKFVISYLN